MKDICLWKDFSYVFFTYNFFSYINNICSIFFSRWCYYPYGRFNTMPVSCLKPAREKQFCTHLLMYHLSSYFFFQVTHLWSSLKLVVFTAVLNKWYWTPPQGTSGIYLKFTFRWVCGTSLLNRRVLRCLNKRILVLNVKDKNQGLCSIVNESQDDLIWRCRAFFSSTSYCCQINNSQERGQMLKRFYFPLLVMPAFDLECV